MDRASAEGSADGEEEIEACELCGKQMQLKRGRFGPFYGCSGYPECRNIRKISKSGKVNAPPVPIDEKCPLDDAQLVKTPGPLRRIHLVLELSEVQVHQAGNHRR